MITSDKRLIEDFLPIKAISAEASREKNIRKGHITTLHLWWARRPLVACRAAVFAALVPADWPSRNAKLREQVERDFNGELEDLKKKHAGKAPDRATSAAFMKHLCKYPGSPRAVQTARRIILEAHAERLTQETGKKVTVEDVEGGHAPRPRVLDMFAGGGAIPLEALRLGCEAYALDLNPVAHIIELCTLVYPQKYGKPDQNARGMTGPKNAKGEMTWGGLANEVRYWGNWILKKVKAEIGDLYPPIRDPAWKGKQPPINLGLWKTSAAEEAPSGYLMPVAYLWTRTVTCKNADCKATVPLVKQTWLCKKADRYVAMRMVPDRKTKRIRFEVVEATSEKGLGFDPEAGSKAGNATCPFCGTVADSDYVKAEACSKRMGQSLTAVACTRPGAQGKVYLSSDSIRDAAPDAADIEKRIDATTKHSGISVPDEPIEANPRSMDTQHFGFQTWGDLFSPRQCLCLQSFAAGVHAAEGEMQRSTDPGRIPAVVTLLAAVVDRLADFNSSLCVFNYTGGRGVVHTFGRQALPMVWDFAETNPFNPDGASWISGIEDLPAGLRDAEMSNSAQVIRGTATSLPWGDAMFDAIVTDPPYYDNVSYSNLSDFFYVWLKRMVGHLYLEHFAAAATPKNGEAIAAFYRHGGDKTKSRAFYESTMARAFDEAFRVLKPAGELVVVYAHKTTLGWATLVDALRNAGFVVTEAWPLDTEKAGRLTAQGTAALASSIFLIARKRDPGRKLGDSAPVRTELEAIVRERVKSLWDAGVSGADLRIACVGAGMKAFTQYARVEMPNGEEVTSERFLAEVEGVVRTTLLRQLFGAKAGMQGLDAATEFYVLWRFEYGSSEIDAGEAIVFTYSQRVELDGPVGLTAGQSHLLEKKGKKYRAQDFTERGSEERLGLTPRFGLNEAPLIDVLQRLLWLMENQTPEIPSFLDQAKPNTEQLRLLAETLSGAALEGSGQKLTTEAEQSALQKLVRNWTSLVDDNLFRKQ